jgi:hypothetical protein
MIDRRSFLTGGAALAAGLTAWPARAAASPTNADASAALPSLVLVDRQLDGSSAIAANARASGVIVREFTSDAGNAWMRELEPRFRLGSVVIDGYTGAPTLFCLELLARDYGARVVRRRDASGGVIWRLSSNPLQRAALAPLQSPRGVTHA